jgi:hypothetical protein
MMIVATVLFGLAVLHTFLVSQFARIATRYPEGSVRENFFHLLSEVEIVFGLWAGIYVAILALASSPAEAVQYIESRNFTEPLFVFVIMAVCATTPVLNTTVGLMDFLSSTLLKVLSFTSMKVDARHQDLASFIVIMAVGPLLGSLITEPAAMTVCALMLLKRFYSRTDSQKLMYAMTGLLFVNISIGGTLTSFAAPPVLMVAQTWNWDSLFMLQHFGWKAVIACFVSTGITATLFRKELMTLKAVTQEKGSAEKFKTPIWLASVHLLFVAMIVLSAHHAPVFVGLFLFFIGVTTITKEYQAELRLKEGLLVAFFLGGLVVLGGPQGWWIAPLLEKFDGLVLFTGAAGLTAVTDNAALTYLGSLVPGLSDASKYNLVAGAVVGGGLTVIANAPNPAGHGILNSSFGESGMSPLGLFKAALLPTAIAGACYWFF